MERRLKEQIQVRCESFECKLYKLASANCYIIGSCYVIGLGEFVMRMYLARHVFYECCVCTCGFPC